MSILKELLAINEAAPVEISKLIRDRKEATGPNAAAFTDKYIKQLFATGTLTWHGDKFHSEHGSDTAWKKAEDAAKYDALDGDDLEVEIDVNFSPVKDETDFINVAIPLDEHSLTEVYLAYSPSKDALFVGFDVHTSVEDGDYHQQFEKTFKEVTGETFDEDNKNHEKVFDNAWKIARDKGFFGMVYEVKHNGGSYEADQFMYPIEGGFYRSCHSLLKSKVKDLIELRLD